MDGSKTGTQLTDAQRSFLAQYLGYSAEATAPTDQTATVKDRLAAAVRQIKALPTGASAALATDAKAVMAALNANDQGQALEALEQLEAALKAPDQADTGFEKLLPMWTSAKDEIDPQLDALTTAMRGSGLPLFERIADAGLHAITKGQFVALQSALMSYDQTANDAKQDAAKPVRQAIQAMRDFLTGEAAIGLLEKNPFGIDLPLKARLGAALDRIDTGLGSG